MPSQETLSGWAIRVFSASESFSWYLVLPFFGKSNARPATCCRAFHHSAESCYGPLYRRPSFHEQWTRGVQFLINSKDFRLNHLISWHQREMITPRDFSAFILLNRTMKTGTPDGVSIGHCCVGVAVVWAACCGIAEPNPRTRLAKRASRITSKTRRTRARNSPPPSFPDEVVPPMNFSFLERRNMSTRRQGRLAAAETTTPASM